VILFQFQYYQQYFTPKIEPNKIADIINPAKAKTRKINRKGPNPPFSNSPSTLSGEQTINPHVTQVNKGNIIVIEIALPQLNFSGNVPK